MRKGGKKDERERGWKGAESGGVRVKRGEEEEQGSKGRDYKLTLV